MTAWRDARHAEISADEAQWTAELPEGTMARACADLNVAARRFAVEVAHATRVPHLTEWLSRRPGRDTRDERKRQ